MTSIPGAHASLSFGRKQVEFYAAPGATAEAGAHLKRGEHTIRDLEGHSHTVRLSRPDTPLEAGETVTVLRMQTGPDRESQPVAVVNHDRNAWTRTAPEGTRVLAQNGVTRAGNWWMTIIFFMLATLALTWSDVRLVLLEIDPGLFASAPEFNLFNLVSSAIPALVGFDLAGAIPGFADAVAGVGLPGWASPNLVAFLIPLTLVGLMAYGARTWRILWAPLYLGVALATGLALSPEAPLTPTLLSLGGLVLLFAIGGFINRVRDSSRFEGRVARLSENILKAPPTEAVSTPIAAGAALATAGATAISEPEEEPAPDLPEPPVETSLESPVEEVSEEMVTADAEDSDAVDIEDDLPSDEALAAARAELDSPVVEGDTPSDTSPVTSLQAAGDAADTLESQDRDMVMPPPPPMALRVDSNTGEAENEGVSHPSSVMTSPEADAPDVEMAEPVQEGAHVDVSEAENAISESDVAPAHQMAAPLDDLTDPFAPDVISPTEPDGIETPTEDETTRQTDS